MGEEYIVTLFGKGCSMGKELRKKKAMIRCSRCQFTASVFSQMQEHLEKMHHVDPKEITGMTMAVRKGHAHYYYPNKPKKAVRAGKCMGRRQKAQQPEHGATVQEFIVPANLRVRVIVLPATITTMSAAKEVDNGK